MPIRMLMRRLLAVSILVVLALAALVGSAMAATPKPVITSFSPAQVRIGQTLVINGKDFARGGRNNRVYFRRASDGKTVRARAKKATTRRIEVVVPPSADDFLKLGANGQKQATRFRLAIFTKTFGPYTKSSRSPLILPANAQVPTSGPVTTLPPPDCDTDGVPDSTDTDDDNDLLTDETEKNLGTDPCKKDTDGDGVEDGYEFYSAVDLNG